MFLYTINSYSHNVIDKVPTDYVSDLIRLRILRILCQPSKSSQTDDLIHPLDTQMTIYIVSNTNNTQFAITKFI